MQSINLAVLVGNLTRDPELRATRGGTSVTELGIAVNGREKINGEWQDRADFFTITVWGNQADNCAQYLEKGSKVAIEGRLRYEKWEAEDGSPRSAVKIVADTVLFLDSAGSGERRDGDRRHDSGDEYERSQDPAPAKQTVPPDDDIPF